jgi:uncharacterized membrane protein YfcA
MNAATHYVGAAAVGAAAGFTLGLCGWGGAQIIKPALTSGLGISQLAANGTSLTSLAFASTTSAIQFASSDNANWQIAAAIALPSVFGARMGVRMSQKLSSDALALIFNGMSVILIPTHFFVQQYRENHPHPHAHAGENEALMTSGSPPPFPNWAFAQHAAFGASMGVISSLMGVGGAPLVMSYLTIATDLPHHEVQGTMMLSVVPAVITSAASLMFGGHTPLRLATAVCCGSVAGSAAGAHVALGLSEKQLRDIYMASLVLLGGRSFVAAIGNISRLTKGFRFR